MLSHGLWQSRFGGDPGILERRIQINGRPFTVVGVAPAGFRFPVDNPAVQLWTTLSEDATVTEFTPLTKQRGARVLDAIGRLKPGVTAEQARAQMDLVAGALARQHPDDNKNTATTWVGVLFGMAPVIQAVRADPSAAIKEGARNIARGHHRFRSALVVGQVTLGLMLLVGAELLIASFLHLVQRDPGFRADHLLTFDIGLPGTDYNAARQIAFCDRLIERLRAIPGVLAAATGVPLPLAGHQMSVSFDIEERPADTPDRPHSDMAIVTPGYFTAMGIPLLKGRDFSERDDAAAPPVLAVNEAFAGKYFPGQEVVGKRIQPGAHSGEGPRMREIVGVVGNAKQAALGTDADPIYYFPYKQLSWGIGTVVLRTAVPPLGIKPAARAALASLERQAPMYQVRTGEELTATAIAGPRFLVVLMGSFASIAVLLTAVGLYGVLSHAVATRRREIGVRIALGAGRKEVLGMVFRQAAQLVAAGLILGSAGAFGAGRLLEGTVYGVRPGDPALVAGACGVMLIAGMAAYMPAAQAASVDPMHALRSE